MENKKIIWGDLTITEDNKHLYDGLEKVSGYLFINNGVHFEAPNLIRVRSIKLYENSILTAPILYDCGKIELDKYCVINVPILTGYGLWGVSLYKNSVMNAPKLKEVGYVFMGDNAKLNIPYTIGLNYRSVDGDLFVIEYSRTKGDILIEYGLCLNSVMIRSVDEKLTKVFVASKDGFNAHGKTIKKAVEDLYFKISKDKLKKQPITPDTVITIDHYRAITGACELGVNLWLDKVFPGDNIKSMKASDLLPLLKKHHAYGVDEFEELLNS